MKKRLVYSLVAILLAFAVYFGLKPILFPTMAGEKDIQLTISVDAESGEVIVFDELVHTDALTLAELLNEVDEFYDELNIEYQGSATDAYGRMILAVNDYRTEDMASGPWWMINSSNNLDCVAAGYCNGVDLQSIYDQDAFVLNFTSSY